jgi:cbb3-type cytochrome oxidase maturation protein
MESLYLLIPVSIVIVLVIGGLLAWSVLGGQFDDLDAEGRRILDADEADANLADGGRAADARSSVTNAHSDRAS